MRCLNQNCNHALTDFETTRKDKTGAYLDLCVFCCPYDPVEHRINPKFPYSPREAYNENEDEEINEYEDDEDEPSV